MTTARLVAVAATSAMGLGLLGAPAAFAAGSNFLLWAADLGDGTVSWRFAMANADAAGAWSSGYDLMDTITPAARVQIEAWTKLTASYNASTGQMALYVNGALAATGTHKTPFAPTGTLVIGRYQNRGVGGAWFHGGISDVAVYPYATVPTS